MLTSALVRARVWIPMIVTVSYPGSVRASTPHAPKAPVGKPKLTRIQQDVFHGVRTFR